METAKNTPQLCCGDELENKVKGELGGQALFISGYRNEMVKIPYVPCYQVHLLLKERDKNCEPVEILILVLGTFRD